MRVVKLSMYTFDHYPLETIVKKLSAPEIYCAAALFLGVTLTSPQSTMAQNHVVPPAQIQNDLSASSAARQKNEEHLKSFLSSKEVQQAMKSTDIDPQRVTNAIGQLNDADLAQLAARSARAQRDFAAGNIDNHDLLLILVGIAALILIIVAVR